MALLPGLTLQTSEEADPAFRVATSWEVISKPGLCDQASRYGFFSIRSHSQQLTVLLLQEAGCHRGNRERPAARPSTRRY